jgi:hypothetical protein
MLLRDALPLILNLKLHQSVEIIKVQLNNSKFDSSIAAFNCLRDSAFAKSPVDVQELALVFTHLHVDYN